MVLLDSANGTIMTQSYELEKMLDAIMRVAANRVDGLIRFGTLLEWNFILLLRSAYIQGLKDMADVYEKLSERNERDGESTVG